MIVLAAAGFAPKAKYDAHTMNDTQVAMLNGPSHKVNGRATRTVIPTASHKGIVSLRTSPESPETFVSVMADP